MEPILQLHDMRKTFDGVTAVDGVSLTIRAGRVLALIGENGAGKTTAMRIASGALPADSGGIFVNGENARFNSPRDASRAGIEMVHQHFMLVPRLSVAENLALADPSVPQWIPPRELASRAEATIARTGIKLADPSRLVEDLSVGEKAKVELVKTLSRRPRVLILDEPTAVLTPIEVEELFVVLRRLAADGVAIVFITHKLAEVSALADDVAVMRAGALILTTEASATTQKEIAAAMTGRPWDPGERAAAECQAGEAVLECRGVSAVATGESQSLDAIDLTVREGEVVAIVGVAGNGQHALAELLRGLVVARAGTLRYRGRPLSSADLLQESTIGHIPPDRTREGIVAELSVAENIALSAPRWSRRGALSDATTAISRFRIKTSSPLQKAGSLSGGNQQKVVLARELERSPQLIVASEPTRGLDIDATRFVHERLREAAARGAGVLLITSDLDEAYSLADGMHVIYRGRLSDRLMPGIDPHRLGELMAGVA